MRRVLFHLCHNHAQSLVQSSQAQVDSPNPRDLDISIGRAGGERHTISKVHHNSSLYTIPRTSIYSISCNGDVEHVNFTSWRSPLCLRNDWHQNTIMCIDPKPISVGKERQIESTMDKDSIQVTNQSSGNEGPVSLATSLVMLLSHPKKQLQEHEAALTRGSV